MGRKNRQRKLNNVSTEDYSGKKQTSQSFSYNKCYCRTQYMSSTIECNWEIVDFWKLYTFVKTFVSMPFPEQGEYEIQIEMRIFPTEDSLEDTIAFYILTDMKFGSFYSIRQIGINGEVGIHSDSNYLNNMMLLYETKVSKLMKNSFEDLLKLNFKFDIFFHSLNTAIHTKYLSPFSPVKNLESEQLMIENDLQFDKKKMITFIIDGEDYSISKNLLCATKSRYFRFLCDTKNDVSDKLIVTENPDVFKEMLSFVFNDAISKLDLYVWEQRIRNSENKVEDFLIIAHKYDVQNLKILCEQILIQNIRIDNALELMQIALQTDAKCLKKSLAAYIKFHINFLRNKQFLSLPETQMNEIIEIINKLQVSEHFSPA